MAIKTKFVGSLALIGCVLLAQGCATAPLNEKTIRQKQSIKNVLFIALDDLRPELNSFGATHIHSPNIDALAENSRLFLNHFVNAPSCGPSRYSLLTGRYGPTSNNAMRGRANALKKRKGVIPASMPAWFKSHGYTTIAVGKISHYPGGNMGKNWDDPSQPELPDSWTKSLMPVAEWETPEGAMHGLAHGEIRKKASEMDVFQAADGDDNIYPDGLITDEAIQQLQQLTKQPEMPFFLAVGLIKPHLPFGAPKKYFDLYEGVEFPENPYPNKPKGPSTWFNSSEFMQYNRWGKNPIIDEAFAKLVRRHYAACVSYADARVGKILQALKDSGADKNTVVVLWGDHGWNLGEHGMWGKHNLYEQALRSPLLISYPDMPSPGEGTKAVVETADIFPTLTKLTGLPMPEQPHGKSLIEQVNDPDTQGHAAYAYWRHNHSIRMGNFRLTHMGKKGFALYDLASKEKETKNVAEQYPELVKKMMTAIKAKMQQRDKF